MKQKKAKSKVGPGWCLEAWFERVSAVRAVLTCHGAHQQTAHNGGQCPNQGQVEVGQGVPGVCQGGPAAGGAKEIKCTACSSLIVSSLKVGWVIFDFHT